MTKREQKRMQKRKRLILYHGTSSKFVEEIREKGLLPRVETNSKSNWQCESKQNYVYLTKFPLFYAAHSAENNDSEVAIVRVEVPPYAEIYPDEDYLHYLKLRDANYKHLPDNKDIRIEDYQSLATSCLRNMGNLAVKRVRPEWITGIAIVVEKKTLISIGLYTIIDEAPGKKSYDIFNPETAIHNGVNPAAFVIQFEKAYGPAIEALFKKPSTL